MSMKNSMLGTPAEEEKINSHYSQLLNRHLSADAHPNPNVMKDQPHEKPPVTGSQDGPFSTPMMNYSNILAFLEEAEEAYNQMKSEEEADIGGVPMGMPPAETDRSKLLQELDQIYTPVLIMQGFENDIADKAEENFAEAAVITEKNIFKFDDSTRMAQIIATAAMIIARDKQTEKWKVYEKSSMLARQAKLDIQREEYEEAKILAQQYLVKVATTNNSSVARKAANDLLPCTQH